MGGHESEADCGLTYFLISTFPVSYREGEIASTGAPNFAGGAAFGLGGTTVIQPLGQSLT